MAGGPSSTPAKPKPAVATADDGYVRLHITPFDEQLLSVVIPSAVLPQARNLSYHTIETLPEKRYGFVDLPKMDADKLKKKLNGAVLKGTKMRIEQAKAESIRQPTPADNDDMQTKKTKKEKKSKKRKRENNVVEGVELEDRKVKRGWTVSEKDMIKEKKSKRDKDKKDKKNRKKQKSETKSKYTDGPECLFKQKLPTVPGKKEPEAEQSHRKKKRKSDNEIVVHEFEKTTKYPSFLKSTVDTSKSEQLSFEEGKGWVNSKGKVVEVVKSKKGPHLPLPERKKEKRPETPVPEDKEEEEDETSSSGTSSEDESHEEGRDDSDSGSDSEEVEADAPEKKPEVDQRSAKSNTASVRKADATRPRSSGSNASLTIKIPPVTPATVKVQELEALYKPAQSDGKGTFGQVESKPFSFFDNDDDIEMEDEENQTMGPPPMTPFTKQDFDSRAVRSAAPTPDTAAPNRTFSAWPTQTPGKMGQTEDEDEDDDHMDDDAVGTPAAGKDASQAQPREFEKWFYEHRGDLSRSWKKRRKLVAKEKRNRDNRARAARAI